MNGDLINKTELMAQIKQAANRGDGKPLDLSFGEVLGLILDAPEVDAEQVIRCGQCRRWEQEAGYGLDINGEKKLYGVCDITKMSCREDHYCGSGRQRDGE